jgi:hypothetical protein
MLITAIVVLDAEEILPLENIKEFIMKVAGAELQKLFMAGIKQR